ncbi:MAG TPA: D-alanyl-D-alanine carboxypeptidase [Myxococcales bacterium]|nr:D-alanyl-D-alanine carboxypeptidase [Myxococcales bacterium]
MNQENRCTANNSNRLKKPARLGRALLVSLLASSFFGCPELTGTNGAVRDVANGRFLYSQSLGGVDGIPYSTVKVMTLHLALRAIKQGKFDENTYITISQHADDQDCNCFPGGNMSVLVPGDKMPVLMALYSIGLSHGEPTMAMAELVANVNRPTPVVGTGTSKAQSKVLEQEFIDMMNAEAFNLGLDNTHYTSVHGAPSATQVTSVRDLAKLWDAAVAENSSFLTYTGTRKFPTLTWSPLSAAPYWANMTFPDRPYNYYPGIDGDKNGGRSPGMSLDIAMVTRATRADRSLTASVLLATNQTEANQDTAELFRWGYEEIFRPTEWAEASHGSSVAQHHAIACYAGTDVVTASHTANNALELIRWSVGRRSSEINKVTTLAEAGGAIGDVDVAWVGPHRIATVSEAVGRGGPTIRVSLYGTDDGLYFIHKLDLGPGTHPQVERMNSQRITVAFVTSGAFELRTFAVAPSGLSLENSLTQSGSWAGLALAQTSSPIGGSPGPGNNELVAAILTTPTGALYAKGYTIHPITGYISTAGSLWFGIGTGADVVRSGPLGHYAVSMRQLNGALKVIFFDGDGPDPLWIRAVEHSNNPVFQTAVAALGQHEFSAVVAERRPGGRLAMSVWDLDERMEMPNTDFDRLSYADAAPGWIQAPTLCELSMGPGNGNYVTSARGPSGELKLSAWRVGS